MSLDTQLAALMPAIRTLLVFTRVTRGSAIRRRELDRIGAFIRDHAALPDIDNDSLAAWANRVRCWDVQDDEECYSAMVRSIPGEQLATCQHTARCIAHGSGRQPVRAEITAWIDAGFVTPPGVMRERLFSDVV